MIYQPKNVLPKSGSAVNSSEDTVISMDIQTNSYINQYILSVYDKGATGWNDTPIYVYNSGELTSDEYIYNNETLTITLDQMLVPFINGNVYGWSIRLFQPTPNIVVTTGTIVSVEDSTNYHIQMNPNIKVGMCIKREGLAAPVSTISAYDVETGAITLSSIADPFIQGEAYQIVSFYIDTTPLNVFYYWQEPTIEIEDVPETITTRIHTFQGTCNDDQSPIVWYKFDLYEEQEDGTFKLIDSTGEVYSARLNYTYDSFMSGQTYKIQMTMQNDFGQTVYSDLYQFDVSYAFIEYLQQPVATCNANQNAINVSWAAPVENDGRLAPILKPERAFTYVSYTTTNAGVTFTASNTRIGLSGYSTAMEPSVSISLDETMTFLADKTYELNLFEEGDKTDTNPSIYPVLYFQDSNSNVKFILKPEDFPYTYTPTEDVSISKIMVLPVYHVTYTDYTAKITAREVVPTESPSDAKYLYNTPFNGVNSLYTDNYEVIWENEDGLCTLSDDFDISFVFNLDLDFFIDSDNNAIEEATIFETEADVSAENDMPSFIVKINKYDLILESGDTVLLRKNIFGGNISQTFVLSAVPEVDQYKDYMWSDTATWADTYYWVEGLSFNDRMCNKWWKVEIKPTSIKAILM